MQSVAPPEPDLPAGLIELGPPKGGDLAWRLEIENGYPLLALDADGGVFLAPASLSKLEIQVALARYDASSRVVWARKSKVEYVALRSAPNGDAIGVASVGTDPSLPRQELHYIDGASGRIASLPLGEVRVELIEAGVDGSVALSGTIEAPEQVGTAEPSAATVAGKKLAPSKNEANHFVLKVAKNRTVEWVSRFYHKPGALTVLDNGAVRVAYMGDEKLAPIFVLDMTAAGAEFVGELPASEIDPAIDFDHTGRLYALGGDYDEAHNLIRFDRRSMQPEWSAEVGSSTEPLRNMQVNDDGTVHVIGYDSVIEVDTQGRVIPLTRFVKNNRCQDNQTPVVVVSRRSVFTSAACPMYSEMEIVSARTLITRYALP